MTEPNGDSEKAVAGAQDKRGDARKSKTIRFSEPEWKQVERAAAARGIAAAEFVRAAAMDAAEGKIAALDAEMVETIRRIYRSTYIVATLKRDELLRDGRGDEIEKTVEAARNSQATLVEQTAKPARPGAA